MNKKSCIYATFSVEPPLNFLYMNFKTPLFKQNLYVFHNFIRKMMGNDESNKNKHSNNIRYEGVKIVPLKACKLYRYNIQAYQNSNAKE